MESNTSAYPPTTSASDTSANIADSSVLAAWSVVFSVEAGLVMALNLYTSAFLVRGNFDRVRYFSLSFAFIDIIRGFVAIVIVLGLMRSPGIDCKMDYHELHLALQTFCDVFSMSFLAAISFDMYCRIFWPLKHMFTRARWYISANFVIWVISMTSTMLFAFALARFYQEIFADLVIWFIEIASLTVICTCYFLILQNCRSSNEWIFGKRNFTLAKAFMFSTIIYLVVWTPIEILEGISKFQKSLSLACNGLLLMKFLKTFCSLVSPVVYLKYLSPFCKSCRCSTMRRRKQSTYLADSLPLITLRSALYFQFANEFHMDVERVGS